MKPESIIRPALMMILGGSVLLAVSSCASPAPKAASAKDKDYDLVYETGSNLPKRVPKKHPEDATAGSPVQTVSADALNNSSDHTAFKPPPGVGK